MSDNEKARPGEATPEQAQGMNETAEETASVSHNITGQERGQAVSSALGRGREHGVKASELQAMFGYTPREIRLRVNYERVVRGQLICANKYGYFYGSDSEVEANIRTLRKTAASDLAVADALEHSLRRRQGQQVMEDLD